MSLTVEDLPPVETGRPDPSSPLRRYAARFLRGVRRFSALHWLFMIVLSGAVGLRGIAMLGFPGMMWFGDSAGYLESALRFQPGETRPSGYPLVLWILMPFHDYSVVLAVQHLMGVATGVLIYAVVYRAARDRWPGRRWLPGLVAAPFAIPALYPTHQISLEHMLMADGQFTFLVVAAAALVLWRRRMSWWSGTLAGVLLGLATLTRSLGLALLAIFLLCMVIRGSGWRPITAMVAACMVPVVAYMTWVNTTYGDFSFGKADGIWLYYRTADFADCGKIKPRPELAIMCPHRSDPRMSRSFASTWSKDSPFRRLPGWVYGTKSNELASEFSKEAIKAQPGDYARVILRDTFRAFEWERKPYPTPWTVEAYDFPKGEAWKKSYAEMSARYADDGRPRVVDPYASWMLKYQRHFDMPGTILGFIMLVGLGGVLVRIPVRRRGLRAKLRHIGGPGLLPFGLSLALLVIPAATADFDYRYVLPAVPLAALAAGLALIPRRPEPAPAPAPAAEAEPPARDPEPEPDKEPATEPATESATEPATEPATGPVTEPATEPATGPVTEE